MTEPASVRADAVPVARYRASHSPRKRQDQISPSKDFNCRDETEVSYLASRPRPASPVESKRHAGARPVLRSGTLEGGRAPSPVDSRPTYPVERSLLQADGLALSLRGALDLLAPLLARAAAAFVRSEAWSVFGFARLGDHARERFGRSSRWVRDLAALGDALVSLPGLATALGGRDGAAPLGRVAALLVGRAATAASLAAWIALGRSVPVRELRDAARRAAADDFIRALPEKTLSDPIRVPGGWAIIRVLEKKAFDPAAFEKDKVALIGSLRQQRREELFRSFMQEARKRVTVQRNVEAFKRAMAS